MPLQMLTPPNGEPLDLGDVRQHCKQDTDADDAMFAIYLAAAREYCEAETGRQILAARYRYIMDSFPGPSLMGVPYGKPFGVPPHAIVLPRSPAIQVEAIHYLDMAGQQQTVPADLYTVDRQLEPARITPVFGRIWPVPLPQIGSVWVDFWAGYCAPVTADANANTVTVDGWPDLEVGAVVRLSNSGGALPVPLVGNRPYWVESVRASGVYTLSASQSGAAINITGAGTGTHYLGQPANAHMGSVPPGLRAWMLLRTETLYNHRGESAVVRGNLSPLPHVDRMLDPYRLIAL
jgi:uncharacterized phiE125 gp8 family phage protein